MSTFFHRLPEFASNHIWLFLAFVILLIALAVTEVLHLFSKHRALTPGSLTLLINRQDASVFDLSSHNDYQKAHIPGAAHLPVSQFGPQNKTLEKLRESPVVLICKDGRASAKAAQKLIKDGYQKVYTLAGGMGAWEQAQLPMAKGRS